MFIINNSIRFKNLWNNLNIRGISLHEKDYENYTQFV